MKLSFQLDIIHRVIFLYHCKCIDFIKLQKEISNFGDILDKSPSNVTCRHAGNLINLMLWTEEYEPTKLESICNGESNLST